MIRTFAQWLFDLTDKQRVEQFIIEERADIEDAKKQLHLDVVVSRRYWKRTLAPSFYRAAYLARLRAEREAAKVQTADIRHA